MDLTGLTAEIFGESIRRALSCVPRALSDKPGGAPEEIRLRAGLPLSVKLGGCSLFVSRDMKSPFTDDAKNAYIVTQKDVSEALALISGYSAYAFEEEIKNGFITIKGGHRVGICGKAVVENGEVKTIKNVSSLNVRLQKEVKGCADMVMPYIIRNKEVLSTIIISPPGKGKTTLLRDIARQLSSGVARIGFEGTDVSIVDERSEIAAMREGVPGNDLGERADVLDGCPKDKGMKIALRSMSPSVVVVDEIGRESDVSAIEEMCYSGVSVICTAHGKTIEDIESKPALRELIGGRLFALYITLEGNKPGKIGKIYDKNLKLINKGEGTYDN